MKMELNIDDFKTGEYIYMQSSVYIKICKINHVDKQNLKIDFELLYTVALPVNSVTRSNKESPYVGRWDFKRFAEQWLEYVTELQFGPDLSIFEYKIAEYMI